MHAKSFSHFFLILLSTGLLFLAACEEQEEEMVEQPIEGALLNNGPVPPISQEGAMELKAMISDLPLLEQYKYSLQDALISLEEVVRETRRRRAEEEGIDFDPDNVPDFSDFDAFVESHVTHDGRLNVEPQSDHYLVTFPTRTFIDLNNTNENQAPESVTGENPDIATEEAVTTSPQAEDKVLVLSHDVQLEVQPTGDPKAWRVNFIFGEDPFGFSVMRNGETSEVVRLDMDTEDMNGLWHDSFQYFVQLEGIINNLMVQVENPRSGESFDFQLGRLALNNNLQPNANNLWSGSSSIEAQNLVFDMPESTGGEFEIFQAGLTGQTEALNPQAYDEFWPIYLDFNEQMASAASDDAEEFTPEQFLTFIRQMRGFVENAFAATDMNFQLKGLKITKPTTSPNMPPREITIDEMNLGGSMSGHQQNNADISLRYSHNNMNLAIEKAEDAAELLPKNVNINAGFQDIPLLGLMDMGIGAGETAVTNEEQNIEEALVDIQDQAIQLMADNNTAIVTDNTYIGNDIWLLLTNGQGTFNTQSPINLVGRQEIRFYGMDVLMQNMQARAQDYPEMQQPIQQTLMGLGMLQMFGQQGQDEQGRAYRGYTFEINENGDLLLNGTNMKQLMGQVPQLQQRLQ